MQFGKVIRDHKQNRGIVEYSPDYFEMTYLKYEDKLTMVFMAPGLIKAKIKAQSILHTYNGSKILNIRRLNSKNLGPDITWYRNGIKYSRYQSKKGKKDNES